MPARANPGELDVKTAKVNATALGDTQLVAAVTGRRITVLAAVITNNGASVNAVKLRSGTTEDITAPHDLAADGGGYAVNAWPLYYCQTNAGEALNVNLAAAGDVGVDIVYILE